VVPEYNGALLTSSVDPGTTAISTTDVDNALDRDLPATLQVLNPAAAQDKDSLTVSRTLANRYGLKSIADLTRVAGTLILGAPVTFDGREEGTAGIENAYGVNFTHFIPLDYGTNSDAAIRALEQDEVQVADVYSTAPQIKTDHLVMLTDPRNLFRADNVIPLVYKPAVQANQKIAAVLNYVSLRLTQAKLEDLDVQAAAPDPDLQAMAYTMATNRHITPKPGQGWREWAAGWTLVTWLPAWVGQNSLTVFRHESGSTWAIPGRTSTTVKVSAQKVDRNERSLVHSERSTSPKVDARKAARWSGPVRAIVASVIGSPRPPGTPRSPGSVP
jgi:glycine betaine/choline ABC-type transport system substrate-binding protein